MAVKLYDGCWVTRKDGRISGPTRDSKDGSEFPFLCGGIWCSGGGITNIAGSWPESNIISVHRSEAAARAYANGGKWWVRAGLFFIDAWYPSWYPKNSWARLALNLVVAWAVICLAAALFAACTATEPDPVKCHEKGFTNDGKRDTVYVVPCDNSALVGKE